MPRKSNKERKEKAKSTPGPLFFYGGELSNFYPSEFYDRENGQHFFCNEQYMMYQKAVLFGDDEIAVQILNAKSNPRLCKGLGRKVRNFDKAIWDEKAKQIVAEGAYLKFSQNKRLREFLLSTGNRELVEASPRDRIWGIGYACNEAPAVPRDLWGENWLGLALMEARAQLKAELDTDS